VRARLAFVVLSSAAMLFAREPSAATPTPTTAECAQIDLATESSLRSTLLKSYSPSYRGCSLEVEFDACAPAGSISSMVIENGYGHSFDEKMAITELTPEATSGWSITRLVLSGGKGSLRTWAGEATDGVRVLRATIGSTALDAAIERARALSSVTLIERTPPGFGFGGWMSSCDFHDALVVSAGGSEIALEHTGYTSSDEQMRYLALDLAVHGVDGAISEKALVDAPVDPAARSLFVDRMIAGAAYFDEEFHWWVREDFLRAAGDAGDARLIPLLARYVASHPAADDPSGNRSRVEAINALAAITRDDRRFDAAGKERSVDVVAADYLANAPKP
jgi:hypothetical protein